MTTTLPRRRRPRDVNTKRADLQQSPEGKGSTLPEYLGAHAVSALIAAAPNHQAKLLILEQWGGRTPRIRGLGAGTPRPAPGHRPTDPADPGRQGAKIP